MNRPAETLTLCDSLLSKNGKNGKQISAIGILWRRKPRGNCQNFYTISTVSAPRRLSFQIKSRHIVTRGFSGKQLTKRLDDWEFKKNKARRRSDLIEKHTIFAQQREHFNTQRISSGGESRLFQQTEFTQFVEGVAKGNDWMQGIHSRAGT